MFHTYSEQNEESNTIIENEAIKLNLTIYIRKCKGKIFDYAIYWS
jgi:hypothetical protein